MAQYKLKQLTAYNGNPYYAGVYNETELPQRILEDPTLVEKITDNPDELRSPAFGQAITEVNVSISTQKDIQGDASFTPAPPKVVSDDLNINTATVEQINQLSGVNMSNATAVVSQREETPFVDFADLDSRVPLKSGKKWKSFAELKF